MLLRKLAVGSLLVVASALAQGAPKVPAESVPASLDDILPVEKPADQAGRNRVAVLLGRTRLDFRVQEMTPQDLCRYLTRLTGDQVNFLWLDQTKAAVVAPIQLELKAANLLTTMAALQAVTGLQFVYRDGLVVLTPKDQFAPLTELRVYNLRAAVMPLRSFPGPKLGLRGAEGGGEVLFPPEEDSGTTVSGFTADGIERLLTENVTPELWGNRATLTNSNGLFLIRHTASGHRAVRALLEGVGVIPMLPGFESPAVGRLPGRVR